MKSVPLQLLLPDGAAWLVAGSFEAGHPQYERDGQVLAVDVFIPPDLEAAGWFWNGSFLHQCLAPDACGISICTVTFPPPGHSGERGDCFSQARLIERLRAEHDTHARPEQLVMELT